MGWSFEQWQCMVGVIKQCQGKGAMIDWDQPNAWKALVDEIIPMTEILFVFGVQYLASELGENYMKAINALRCATNNLGTNSWNFAAATWAFIVLIGVQGDVVQYVNEGYDYICTCLFDANGLKQMMGASEESSAVFASCSEVGANQSVAADQKRLDLEARKVEATKKSAAQAAERKKIIGTVAMMTSMVSCAQKGTTSGAKACYAAVTEMKTKEFMAAKYWKNMTGSGKFTATPKSKEIRDSKNAQSTWVLKGVNEGLHKIFPERFDKYGDRITSCKSAHGDVYYGVKCVEENKKYLASVGPSAFLTKAEALKAKTCFTNNDAGLLALTGDKCAGRELLNGVYQWRDATSTKCSNPVDAMSHVGAAKCVWVNNGFLDSKWGYKAAYVNQDRPEFRSLGKIPVEQVAEADIACLAADLTTIRKGSANCWPYWLESQTLKGIDQYVWLTTEGVTCLDAKKATLNGVGAGKCKIKTKTKCGISQMKRLDISKTDTNQTCIPAFTFEQNIGTTF